MFKVDKVTKLGRHNDVAASHPPGERLRAGAVGDVPPLVWKLHK